MSKFNVGDKVKLRDDLTVKEMNESPRLTEEMWGFMRKEQFRTINYLIEIDEFVTLNGDDNEYFYKEDWLDLVEPAMVHDFEVGDCVKMVEPASSYIEATVGKIYEIVADSTHVLTIPSSGYTIVGDLGGRQSFNSHDYRYGKFVKVEQTELTLKEIADKFNIPIEKLRIKEVCEDE